MKVFISCSGEPSRTIARAIRRWPPLAIQQVDPWMSEEEIKSGTRWGEEVARSLDLTDFGIICVTNSNQHSPWLLFEAGAIAKRLNLARIVPICIDLVPADITGPLAGYQAVRTDKQGMKRLVIDVNEACERPMPRQNVEDIFEPLWPELNGAIAEAMRLGLAQQPSGARGRPGRTDKELLGELLVLVRQLGNDLTGEVASRLRRIEATINPSAREPEVPLAVPPVHEPLPPAEHPWAG